MSYHFGIFWVTTLISSELPLWYLLSYHFDIFWVTTLVSSELPLWYLLIYHFGIFWATTLVSSNLSYSISLLGHSECLYHFTIRMRYLLQELPTCPVHLTLQSFVYGVHVVLVTTTDFMLKNREYYIIMYNFRFTSYLYFFLSVFDFFFVYLVLFCLSKPLSVSPWVRSRHN